MSVLLPLITVCYINFIHFFVLRICILRLNNVSSYCLPHGGARCGRRGGNTSGGDNEEIDGGSEYYAGILKILMKRRMLGKQGRSKKITSFNYRIKSTWLYDKMEIE